MDNDQLRKDLGQLFIVGFTGLTASEDIKSLIRAPYYIGAIILFQRNVESAEQLLSLVTELQQTAKDAGHQRPLFIGIDQENGLVTRIKPPVAPQLPGSMAIGATGSIDSALQVSKATGELLDLFGVNMNYAPCCDVNSEPLNPVIGVRSPSDDGETVGRIASAMAQGLRKQGIVPCVKHFPGHGDTSVDSHYGLPTITKSREALEACDLIPFRRAAAESIEAVMTAHIVVPSLDNSGLPMTLSPKLVNMLRQELQYDGLVITDCLEMDAIRAHFGTAAGALKSLQAGADCVMICHTREIQIDAFETIFNAYRNGAISSERLLQSAKRVHHLKSKFLTWENTMKPRSITSLHQLHSRQGKIAKDLYSRSTTVVCDSQNVLPLSTRSSIVYVYPLETSTRGSAAGSGETAVRVPCIPPTFVDTLRLYTSQVSELPFYDGSELDDDSRTLVSQADAVILVTRNAKTASYQKQMGLKLAKLANKVLTIAACDPYDFIDTPEVSTNIAMYEPTPEAFRSAVNIIFGSAKATGKLPVLNSPLKKSFTIEPFSNERDMTPLIELWSILLPQYRVPADRLANLLTRLNGKHFVARAGQRTVGYVVTFTNADRPTGFISALLVNASYQHQGIGTALINKAREHLRGMMAIKSITIGSSFPRFWPGVPLDIPEKAQNFFVHRGFCPTPGPTARDYMIDLQTYTAGGSIMQRAADSGVTFTPWREDLYEECMNKQKENFGKDEVWIGAYERLAQAKQHHQAMVALDSSGKQLGWTLMLEPNVGLSADLAFPPLLGEKTGQIGCVGVHPDARKRGVGLALVASAALDLKQRGMEKVFIDWVALVNWYEKVGCQVWREYRPMQLREVV